MDTGDRPIRLLLSGKLAFGPGKAELLEQIREHGSLNAAAGAMEMSYMKAWKMIKALNSAFKVPLVELHRGGKEQGGAVLTATGESVLALYHQSVAAAEKSVRPILAKMNALLAEDERV